MSNTRSRDRFVMSLGWRQAQYGAGKRKFFGM